MSLRTRCFCRSTERQDEIWPQYTAKRLSDRSDGKIRPFATKYRTSMDSYVRAVGFTCSFRSCGQLATKTSWPRFFTRVLEPHHFPFFTPPPLNPLPFRLELPALGDTKRLLFLLKGLTTGFFGARGFGFFTSAGCSLGIGSFFSSDMILCFSVMSNGCKLREFFYLRASK